MDESLPPAVIAERLRSTPNAIRVMLSRLRSVHGIDVPVVRGRSRTIRLPARIMRRLVILGSRRGVASGQVARWIFTAIDRENLFEDLMERGRGRSAGDRKGATS